MKDQNSLVIQEDILSRLKDIQSAASEYGLWSHIKNCLSINYSEDKTLMGYEMKVPKVYFLDFPDFHMRLQEKAYGPVPDNKLFIQNYTYHGHHTTNPTEDYIRFDYEPLKKNFHPLHINANIKKWGDHLTFPDGTNLDISKMSCPKALAIFHRYAKNPEDYPADTANNQHYVKIIEGG